MDSIRVSKATVSVLKSLNSVRMFVDLQAEYNFSEGLGLLKFIQHSGPFIYFQESYNKYFALK